MTYWAAGSAIVGAASNIYAANKQAKAAKHADPFAKYRKLYGKQLKALMEDPGSILDNPAFRFSMDFGLQGVAKQMAAQGYLGSGNEAAALFEFGQTKALDWLSNQQQFLAFLAGAGNNNAGVQMQGNASANNMMQGALGQLGSIAGMFGGSGGGGSTMALNGLDPSIVGL